MSSTHDEPTTISPAATAPKPTRRRRMVAAATLAGACLALASETAASADTFSPYQNLVAKYYGYFGNCNITSGPVFDPYATSHGFAAIAGGQVNCATRHDIQAWSQQLWSPDNVHWYNVGTAGHTYFPNSTGFGTRILESSRLCGSGYWSTRVTVSVAGYQSLHFDSPSGYVNARGISDTTC